MKPLYRRRWFALRKCRVQFNLQCIVIDVGCLWQLFHDFLLCACALPCMLKAADAWQRRSCCAVLMAAPEHLNGFIHSEGASNPAHKMQWETSGAGGWQQVCGFVGMAEHWNSEFQKTEMCGKGPTQQSNFPALTGGNASSTKVGAGHLQLELVFHHLQHF